MKSISLIFKSFILSIVSTAVILIGLILYFFRTVAEEAASFSTYFGAINIDVAIDDPELGFLMSFELSDNLTPIGITIVLLFIFFCVYYSKNALFSRHKANKESI